MRGRRPLRTPFFSPCLPRRGFAELVAPAPTMRALRPAAPGDFLMRRKSPKTHQEPPGSWTSGTRGRTPLDSPDFCPSGIGGGGTEFAASSGAARQSGLPIAFPLSSKKTAASPVGCTGRTWQRGPIRGQELFPDEGDGNREWEQGNKHLFLLYIHFYIYLL